MVRGLIVMANRRWLKGQPCLVDLWRGNYSDRVLFVLRIEEWNILSQLISFLPKSDLSRVCNKSKIFMLVEIDGL